MIAGAIVHIVSIICPSRMNRLVCLQKCSGTVYRKVSVVSSSKNQAAAADHEYTILLHLTSRQTLKDNYNVTECLSFHNMPSDKINIFKVANACT